MNITANPGIGKIDFELWSPAVSAVNGCGRRLELHEQVLSKAGMSREHVQDAIKIASIVHGLGDDRGRGARRVGGPPVHAFARQRSGDSFYGTGLPRFLRLAVACLPIHRWRIQSKPGS